MAIRRPTNYDATADIIADLEDMADSIQDELDLKVDKVQGKGLSTNDYTTEEKEKLAGLENYDDTEIQNALGNKVDKVTGKGLSTNDYSTEEKNKLAGVEAQANKTVVDVSLNETSTNPVQNKAVYAELEAKQAEIDTLVEENSTMKKQIPTEHISTTSIQLTDSAEDLPIENVKLKGATWQEQYEGYNLWNGIRRAINGTVVDEVVETTALSYHGWLNVYSKQAISLSANQDYYLSCEIRIKSGSAEKLNYFRPTDYPADSTKVFVQNPNLSSNYQRFICKVTATTAVEVGGFGFQITDGTDAVLECKNFMISTTNVAYEPYVGGQPAPNPEYKFDIHRVTGDCNTKVQNKNLLNLLNTDCHLLTNLDGTTSSLSNYNSLIVDARNKSSIYVSGDFSLLNSGVLRVGLYNDYPAVNVIGARTNLLANGSIDTTNYNYVLLSFNSDGQSYDAIQDSFQVEYSSTASDYTPHAEQNAPLSLGNIEAYEGDEIQIDFVQKAGYKKVTGARLVQNMGEITLDGVNNTFTYKHTSFSTETKGFYRANLPNKNQTKASGSTDCAVSDYFKLISGTAGTAFNNNTSGLWWESTGNAIYAILEETSLDNANLWLTTHNTKIVYLLNNPVTTTITDPTLLAQFETLINMKTYKEVTNIESTGEDLAPILDCAYYQDMSTVKSDIASIKARLDLLEN